MRQNRLYKFLAVLKLTIIIYKTTRASIEHFTYYIPHVIKTVATTYIHFSIVGFLCTNMNLIKRSKKWSNIGLQVFSHQMSYGNM